MTHAGTIELGGSAQSKQGGSSWGAIALTLALVLAMMGAVWFASNAGLVGGSAAKSVADRSYDQIEAQRGAAAVSIDAGRAEYLNGILDRAHATPFAVGGAAVEPSATSGTFHATPLAVGAVTVPPSATSGTFHAGKDPLMVQVKRDRVGGP